MLEEIRTQLGKHFDSILVDEMLEHYRVLKTAFVMQDWEKCLVRGGKFSEAVMKIIHFLRTSEVLQTIKVESEINEVSKATNLPEEIRLIIPRTVRVLYDHRSKRGGAHSCSFDPNPVDSTLVSSLADWVLTEFIRLYWTADAQSANLIVKTLTAKSIPLVERIGDDYVVLHSNTSARKEIGMTLYSRYPERTTAEQLKKWLKDYSAANITTTIKNMEKAKLIHCNHDGVLLTALGLDTVEQESKELIHNRATK
jgi:hypothetical protein